MCCKWKGTEKPGPYRPVENTLSSLSLCVCGRWSGFNKNMGEGKHTKKVINEKPQILTKQFVLILFCYFKTEFEVDIAAFECPGHC